MKYLKIAGKKLAHEVNRFWKDESGMGTVEVILIIVVLNITIIHTMDKLHGTQYILIQLKILLMAHMRLLFGL